MKFTASVGFLALLATPARAAQLSLRGKHDANTVDTTGSFVEDIQPDPRTQELENQVMHMVGQKNAGGMDDLSKLIEETLLPQIMNASDHAKIEINASMAAFEACSPPSFEKGPLKALSDLRIPKKDAHIKCRNAEAELFKESQSCDQTLASLKSAMDAACGAVDAVKRDPADAAKQCEPSPGMDYEGWLESNKQWFVKKEEEYKNLKQKCVDATAAYKAQEPICSSKKTGLNNQRETCNADQRDMEESFCNVQGGLVTQCTDYGDCYAQANDAWNKRKPILMAEEESRKVNYRVFKRMMCLLPILNKGNQKDIDACKDKVWDTKLLDLVYPDAPNQDVCPESGPMPCDKEYKQQNYHGLPAGAIAAECTPCPGGAPQEFEPFKPGARSGKEVCVSNAVYEYTSDWDCGGNDLTKFVVPGMGQAGYEDALANCAQECANRVECSSWNYPVVGNGNSHCWIKHGFRKSSSRGWECGGATSRWHFFTKIPGQECKSPPKVEPAFALPHGILNNFALAKIPKSWKVFSDITYGTASKDSNVFPTQGDCMLWGAKSSANAQEFTVVAFGNRAAVISAGSGKWENGAYWYAVPSKSFGFAPNNQLSLTICDTMNGGDQQRLCWHNNGHSGGWRAGSKLWLNSDQTWRKVVMYGPCSA